MHRAVPLLLAALLALAPAARAQDAPKGATQYDRTEAMVEMRDGVKLFTVVHVPKKADGPLPIILVRTPYSATNAERGIAFPLRELAADGYAFAFQDIRGKFKSEGTFVMIRPARDASDPKAVDEASDTHDTIDWLLKTVKSNNGRVGMLGVSYPGWLTAVAALDPHPALKAASPQASPSDMYLGDDFHHNGAFRLSYGFEYVAMMETDKNTANFKFDKFDTYDWYLKLGALSNVNKRYFKGKLPTWNDFVAHPNYDAFWKKLSLEPRLTKVAVPTLHVGGWYDQEDFRGPQAIYAGQERYDDKNRNFLVIGPWNHGGWSGGRGNQLGRPPSQAARAEPPTPRIVLPPKRRRTSRRRRRRSSYGSSPRTRSSRWTAWSTKTARRWRSARTRSTSARLRRATSRSARRSRRSSDATSRSS